MTKPSLENLEELKFELGKDLAGEIRLDEASRKLYSTDASIYQIEPLGLVLPKNEEDLIATLTLADKYAVPVLPRGSGTSLACQTVGAALIIDCTRYLDNILEINAEEAFARVQPGLVLDAFNHSANKLGIKFGPDPASADRATFGGMLGNNSTGAHSIQFGMSSDNVLEMSTVLADGSQASFAEMELGIAQKRAQASTQEGRLINSALSIRNSYAEEIKARWPKSWRRASGYSLNYLLPWSPSEPPIWQSSIGNPYPDIKKGHINLAPVLVGSEGSLAIISEAKIRLVPLAKKTGLGVLNFNSVAEACDYAPELLALNPTSVELIPREMVRLAREVPAYANLISFVQGDPEAILLVEFSGKSEAEIAKKLKLLGPRANLATSALEQENIWKVRKVALGLLMSRKGDSKPLPFIEDVAVPVEDLGAFVRGLESIFAEHGTNGQFYAHASAGCLHVRPVINLKKLSGVRQMRSITVEVVALANRFGGAMSGEHGDGLARSEWLEATFGPQLSSAFRELKQAADPKNILNPGNIIDAPPMTENLRYGPSYSAKSWVPIMDFSSQGDILGAIEMCNGAGVCRKDLGNMCPSFQATKEEEHSTRGRANLLRSYISGDVSSSDQGWAMAKDALDLCLECKACKAECPSAVDVAKLKYEFLHQHYQSHRRPLRDYFFTNLGQLAKWSGPVTPLVNGLSNLSISRYFAQLFFGLSAKRSLPRFSRSVQLPQDIVAPDLLFLSDPYHHHVHPEVEKACLRLLDLAGYRVQVLPVLGAGRPLISKGMLEKAKRHLSELVNQIQGFDPDGKLPIIGIEPSELYTLKDELQDFFPSDEFIAGIKDRAFLLEEFLIRQPDAIERIKANIAKNFSPEEVLLHGHCYQKAQPPAADGIEIGQEASAALLSQFGWPVEIIDSGCCGMAGSFGYEAEHYELSMQVAEMVLLPKIRKADKGQVIAAPGLSCRTQIMDGAQREAFHPAQILLQALD